MNGNTTIPRCAYHYCGVQALRGIITSRAFRLSNVFFMNDFMEVEWFKEICRKVLVANHDEITQTVWKSELGEPDDSGSRSSSSSVSYSPSRKRYYGYLWNALSKRQFDHIYCGCFSEIPDDLSQWRGYADNASGVALGIDLRAVLDATDSPRPPRFAVVKYDEQTQEAKAREIFLSGAAKVTSGSLVDAETEAAMTYASLYHLAPEFKNPSFAAEKEVRLIADDGRPSPSEEKEVYDEGHIRRLPSEVDFCERRGNLVPFVTVAFPIEAVREIWIGPRFGGELDLAALRLFLTKHGLPRNVPIRRSSSSYW